MGALKSAVFLLRAVFSSIPRLASELAEDFRTWWWPAFVFLYPFFIASSHSVYEAGAVGKYLLTLPFVLGGLFLELTAHRHLSLADVRSVPSALRRRRGAFVAFLLVLWVLLATLASPEPEVALTGSVVSYSDGFLWFLTMSSVFVLVYVRALSDPHLNERTAWGVVLGAALVALLGLAEVLRGEGFYYQALPGGLPIVSFPGKGHLAGYLAIAFAVGAGLFLRRGGVSLLAVLALLAFTIGLTMNRMSVVSLLAAVLVAGLVGLRPRALLLLFVALVPALVGWKAVGYLYRGAEKREAASVSTLDTRLYLWRAALGGIAVRPLFGWGGGVFEHYWANFLNREELTEFLRKEFGWDVAELVATLSFPGGDPVFLFKDSAGGERSATVILFRAHNGFLEKALKWGLPGLGLFLVLLFWGLKGLREGAPESLGLLAAWVFFLLWFPIPEQEGILWALMGAALARAERLRTG